MGAGHLVLDGSLPLGDEDSDTPAVLTPEAKRLQKRTLMREGVLAHLKDIDEMTESALADALGNSSRDKEMFKELLTEMEIEEEITFEKRGKGRYYSIVTAEFDSQSEAADIE